MTNESSPNDAKSIWQNQRTEGIRMSTEEIRRKTVNFERKVLWENALQYGVLLAGSALFMYRFVLYGPDVLLRFGIGMSVAFMFYLGWQIHKRSPFRRIPAEMGAASCLDFYRKDLERRRDHHRRFWWDIGPAIPGIIILWVALARIHQSQLGHQRWVLTAVITVSVLIVLYFWRQSVGRVRKLQGEIDELDALRKPRQDEPSK